MTFTYLFGSNGQMAGSPDRPGDPGGQVLVAQPGLAGSEEHLDVAGFRVADVHHDRLVRQRGLVTAGRQIRGRWPAGSGQGRAGHRGQGCGGEPRGASDRAPAEQGAPGQAAIHGRLAGRTHGIVTRHDDPFDGWFDARVAPEAKATPSVVNLMFWGDYSE